MAGNLDKMRARLAAPVEYALPLSDTELPLNALIGQRLTLSYGGRINCVHCGRKTNKSFSQGYCYPCFQKLAQCDMCIVKPELCHYDDAANPCREPEWGDAHCMTPHIIYLANSSGLKVGITRESQVPTRWLDQGAQQALAILRVQTRFQSGLVEVAFKDFVADKTAWQAMLKGRAPELDLRAQRDALLDKVAASLEAINTRFGATVVERLDETPVEIDYPVTNYPVKISSLDFDKTPELGGILLGIKGQYLIFDTGVINIRKFGGYHITAIA
ncbi:MAG: DUF2797 domain-containing protein [Gammaproteobacteria bacterium]|nr:DUF2797 domain-containing protein [Gammaproteobacteria bacterium]